MPDGPRVAAASGGRGVYFLENENWSWGERPGLRRTVRLEHRLMDFRKRIGLPVILLLSALVWLQGCAKLEGPAKNDAASTQAAASPPALVFMTDFGTANDAVAICKAVMVNIAP